MYHAVRRSLRSICKLRNEVRYRAVKDIFTKERVIKMKCIWKYVVVAACVLLCLPLLFGCSKNKDQIMIYSTSEDFRNEYVRKRLKEEFPDLDIKVEYKSTGELSAKLLSEGKETDCDIILELESTYLEKLGDTVCPLDGIVSFDKYVEELVPENHRYVPWCRLSGGILINTKGLTDAGLAVPESYEDLLKPEYKGKISMPNPASSGTGYIFLLNLINEWGEDEAFAYFDKLAENIKMFTSSGSGPVQELINGESLIGLGMTFQAVTAINNGTDIDIRFFEEGAPHTTYSSALIEGRQTDEKTVEVFQFLVNEVTPEDKELYSPEQIYKDQEITMENFPKDIPYGDMTGIKDVERKDRLLDRWNH